MSWFSTSEVRELLELVHDLTEPAPLEQKIIRVHEGLGVLVPHTTSTSMFFDPLDKSNTVPLVCTVAPKSARQYAEYYIRTDPMTSRHRDSGYGPWTFRDFLSDRDFEKCEFYCDFLRTHDVHHICGVQVRLPSERVIAVGLHRPREMGEFTEKERDVFRLLRPYLEMYLYDAAGDPRRPHALRFFVMRSGFVVPLAVDRSEYRGPPAPPSTDLAARLPDLARRLPREAFDEALRIMVEGARPRPMRLADGARARFRLVRGTVEPAVEVTIVPAGGRGGGRAA